MKDWAQARPTVRMHEQGWNILPPIEHGTSELGSGNPFARICVHRSPSAVVLDVSVFVLRESAAGAVHSYQTRLVGP